MLLIVVTIAIFGLGIFLATFVYNKTCEDVWFLIGVALISVAVIGGLLEGLYLLTAQVGVDGRIASMQAKHDSLVYQLENDIYDNDNDIGKSELYSQIQNYNQTVATGKVMKDDPWIGVFYPDRLYDSLELIELE